MKTAILMLVVSIGAWKGLNCAEARGNLKVLRGPFAVCSESHFFHEKCYQDWGKECPECRVSRNEIVTVSGVRLDPKGECSICTEKFGAEQKPLLVDTAPVEKESRTSGPLSPIAAGRLIENYLGFCNAKKSSMSPHEARTCFAKWAGQDRKLRESVRGEYLAEAISDPAMTNTLRMADCDTKTKVGLVLEMRKRRTAALEAAAAASYPELKGYIGTELTREKVVKVLDSKVYE